MTESRLVGVTDTPAGAGVQEFLGSRVSSLGYSQIMDIWPAGTHISLKAVSASVSPPITSATAPPWDVACAQVPAGKIIIIDSASLLRYSVAPVSLRLCRRYLLAGNCAQAAPASGGAPTVAVVTLGFTVGLTPGNYSYKLAQVNAINQEGPLSTVSATVTPTSTQGINITIPALGTGAVAYRIYRSLSGAAGGPWYWLDDAIAGTYTDQASDAAMLGLRGSVQHPGTTWGNAFAQATPPFGATEAVYSNVGVALASAPTQIFYVSGRGFPSFNAFAPAVTVNTRVRIPLSNEGRAFGTNSPTTFQLENTQLADYGMIQFVGFDKTYATIGGQWVIHGYAPVSYSEYQATSVAGGRNQVKFDRTAVFGPGETVVAQVMSTATTAASVLEVELLGRMINVPT